MEDHHRHREHSPAPSTLSRPPSSPHLPSSSNLPDLFSSFAAPYDEVPTSTTPLNVPSTPRVAKPPPSGLGPSLASPSRTTIHRSVTAPLPPSPSKSIRPLPPVKSGTDTLVVASPEKARSASLGTRGGDKEKERGRSRETTRTFFSEGEKQATGARKEKAYLEKLKLYETKTKLYIVACDDNETRFRVLKIDRVSPPAPRPPPAQTSAEEVNPDEADDGGLTITEDPTVYTRLQKDELVETLKAGNGGAIKVAPDPRRYRDAGWHPFFYGIVGFVRLSSSYRLVLISSRHKCALLGGSYVYASEATLLYPITPASMTTYAAEDYKQEQAFSSIYLTHDFYFSYSYDLTHTLQRNLLRGSSFLHPEDKFAWNWHLLTPLRRALNPESPWILPLVHGSVDQMKINAFARPVYLTLIGRRSRHFAGARYLRRGVNEQGWVANDVESEQIVSEELLTPFHVPSPSLSPSSPSSSSGRAISPRYTSHVQMRGSIPFFWAQDTSKGIIKPDMKIALADPFYSAAARHFDQLFGSYGGRVVAMNLIKQTDHRESNLVPHFRDCIRYLNQFLPDENKIDYIEFDMNTARKRSPALAGEILVAHAERILHKTGFFHSGGEVPRRSTASVPGAGDGSEEGEEGHEGEEKEKEGAGRREVREGPMVQRGVIRTNCIDCIDRTNSAQGLIAEVALAHQLHALGFIPTPSLPPESDAVHLCEIMWNEHGDTLALQYSGSGAIHAVADYKPEREAGSIMEWRSGREKIEALKRLYANSFSDADKQAAIDLYLGISPPLPPPPSFEYLPPPPRRSYQAWFTPSHLTSFDLSSGEIAARLQATVDSHLAPSDVAQGGGAQGKRDDGSEWWKRYYRTNNWTTLEKTWPYRMDGTSRSMAKLKFPIDEPLMSPFISRRAFAAPRPRHKSGLRSWIHPANKSARQSRHVSAAHHPGAVDDSAASITSSSQPPPLPVSSAPFSAPTAQLATAHLAPLVRADEAKEYDAWISQFRHLSLAPTTDHLSEKDRTLYSQHAGVALSELNERDKTLFVATAVAGRPAKGYKPEAGVAPGTLKVYREMVEGPGGVL
ncbi:hypothetical protein JCM6882_001451 [Rhodosporidiobolus microsporus]